MKEDQSEEGRNGDRKTMAMVIIIKVVSGDDTNQTNKVDKKVRIRF